MRVSVVISKFLPEYTGAAYRIFNTYRRVSSANTKIDLRYYCNSTQFPFNKSYEYEGIPVERVAFGLSTWLPERIGRALKFYLEAIGTFRKLLCNKKPDVIHIVGSSGGTAAALIYSRLFEIPRLVELVTRDASPEQFLPGLRYRNFLNLNSRTILIAISPQIAERCAALGYSANVWCRPNPVDEDRFVFDRARKDKERKELTPFGSEVTVIGMVAKFMPQKNQIFLIDVLKRLPENFTLLLAGPVVSEGIFVERDQQYFRKIVDRVTELGLTSRVHIISEFVDAARIMAACDIYAMPQMKEGLGTPMLEAMAVGLPVIVNADEPALKYWADRAPGSAACALLTEDWSEAVLAVDAVLEKDLGVVSEKILKCAGSKALDESFLGVLEAICRDPGDIPSLMESLSAKHEA